MLWPLNKTPEGASLRATSPEDNGQSSIATSYIGFGFFFLKESHEV